MEIWIQWACNLSSFAATHTLEHTLIWESRINMKTSLYLSPSSHRAKHPHLTTATEEQYHKQEPHARACQQIVCSQFRGFCLSLECGLLTVWINDKWKNTDTSSPPGKGVSQGSNRGPSYCGFKEKPITFELLLLSLNHLLVETSW